MTVSQLNSTTQPVAELQVDPPVVREKLRLGELLVHDGVISETDLEAALQQQSEEDQRIGEALLDLGIVSEETILPYIKKQLGFPYVQMREGLIDPAAVKILPKHIAVSEHVVALFCVRNVLTVALTEPDNLLVIDELERLSGMSVNPVFAFKPTIERMIELGYKDDYIVDTVTAGMETTALELNEQEDADVMTISELADGSPIINLVNFIIVQSLKQGASDIHIEPGRKHTSIRFRIDGQLVETLQPRRSMHAAIVSRIKVMAKLDIAEHRSPQDGRCQVAVEGKEVDLRISTIPTVVGEKVVIRVLDRSRLSFNLDTLGMAPGILDATKRLIRKPHGLLLVTGPTGSGKTTTLYSALELMKSVSTNITTVEDPVEYQMEMINQVQIDKNRDFDFALALRSILRQDPDIIMVGEIRDATTAAIAVQAALTGHLVLSTLHTNDAASAVTRLADMGVDAYKVAAALVGVIAQRLVRKICTNCKNSYYPSAEYLAAINYKGKTQRTFARGEGCRQCFDTGFKGRIGIYEVLESDQALRDLIVHDSNIESVRKWFKEAGGKTLMQSGSELAEQEITSLEEVGRIAMFD